MPRGVRYALILIPVCFAATMIWGMLQFPDAPLRPCAQGYCGKYGALHTLADYQRYVWWERISMWGGVLTFAVIFILMITGRAPNREKPPPQ